MRVTVFHEEVDVAFEVEIDEGESVENLKATIEVKTGVPLIGQVLHLNSSELQDGLSMVECHVKDMDVVVMKRKENQLSGNAKVDRNLIARVSEQIRSRLRSAGGLSRSEKAESSEMEVYRRKAEECHRLSQRRDLMAGLSQFDPDMAELLSKHDVEGVAELLRMREEKVRESRRKLEELENIIKNDAYNVKVQEEIERQINEQQILAQFERALEFNPEAFGVVSMLYVNAEVNKQPIHAFIDSGAQVTIMSNSLAEKCGVMRLVDKRMASIAHGVGTSKILGRIHSVMLKIGNSYFEISVSVIEQDQFMFLLGLDMLRRYQCCINLKDSILYIGSEAVPFLSEGELPPHLRQGLTLNETANQQKLSETTPEPSPNDTVSAGKVAQLVALGFPEETASRVLDMCDGNVDMAASHLFSI